MNATLVSLYRSFRKHLPYMIGIALIIVNALIANGDITIAPHTLDLVNAVLAALGLGIVHKRQA